MNNDNFVVMNNDDFVATYPRTVVQYTMKCEATTKIYSVRKLNSLIYVHYVIFLFWTLCFILFVSGTVCRVSKQIFLRDSVRKQKQLYPYSARLIKSYQNCCQLVKVVISIKYVVNILNLQLARNFIILN